jgi:integrase/recombinase XerD
MPAMLIGREQECRLLDDLIRRRKNILMLGPEGVGKSAIVDNVLAAGAVKNVLYSKRSATLKETLAHLVEFALGSRNLQQKNILSLKKICYDLLEARPDYAILDHLSWVEPKFYGFLTYLREQKITFILVTRNEDKKNIGHLWMGLYDFEKLAIKNLDQANTGHLIEYYAEHFDLKLQQQEDFKKKVFTISNGNPKIIKELCGLAREEKYRAKGYVDVKLMDLDRRIKNAVA